MMRRESQEIPYYLARRSKGAREPSPSGPLESRSGFRTILEISSFIVALSAALVAYLAWRTTLDERLTPYRSVVFTAQFESYRDLVRQLDDMRIIDTAQRMMADGTPEQRGRAVIPPCQMQSILIQDIEQHGPNLSVTLVTAQAIWPETIRSDLERANMELGMIRASASLKRMEESLDTNAEAIRGVRTLGQLREADAPRETACSAFVREIGSLGANLLRTLESSLQRIRATIRFDRVNVLPSD